MGKIFTAGSSYDDIEKCISKLNEKRNTSYISKILQKIRDESRIVLLQ